MKSLSSEKSISLGKRIDFHTHILPEMDDGSKSVEMSMQMLHESLRQSICCIVLTPHFYASKDHPRHFLRKRNSRMELLKQNCPYRIPLLICGAEVQYFEGITAMRELPQMRIEKSPGLLIEMPVCRWTNRMIGDLLDLNNRGEYQVILAHIERYLSYGNLTAIRQLAGSGVIMQASADSFEGIWKSRKALQMLDEGIIHILGSDCHNMISRPPNLGNAYDYIEQKRGSAVVKTILQNGFRLLTAQQSNDRFASDNMEYMV